MSKKKLDRLLIEAKAAYQNKERHRGAQLVDEILQQDFAHQETWEFLYQSYGAGQTFDAFQRTFTESYYPEKLSLLKPSAVRKPSLLARIFRRSSRQKETAKPSPAQAPAQSARTPVAARQVPPAEQTPPARRPAPEPDVQPPAKASLLQSAAARSEPSISPPEHKTAPVPRPAAPIARTQAVREKVRVLVVDDISATRETIIRSLRFQQHIDVVATASDGYQGIQMAIETKPDVVIMDVNMPEMDGIEATRRIVQKVPYAQVIILTVQDDIDYMRKAMTAGARDFLAKPPMIDDLVAAVMRAGEIARKEKEKAPPEVVVERPVVSRGGKVITVYSPRGGAGCSMLATNLAAVLHDETTSVLVVDGNLQYGDIPVFFNVQGKNTILHLAPRAEELDAELVEEILIQHPSGIKVLAPPRPEESESINSLQFSQMLKFLRNIFSYVIVDTSHRLGDITLAAIDNSDLVVVVTTHDIPALARMRKFLDLIPALNLDEQRIMIVVNQFDRRMGLTPEKIGQAFRQEVAAVLPLESKLVMTSVNRGTPFMLEEEVHKQPIGQVFFAIAQAVRQRIIQLEQTQVETVA